MPYARIDDGIDLYYELSGPGGRPGRDPVRRRALRPAQLRLRQRRLSRERLPAALLRCAWVRRLDEPARVVHDRGLGRRRREAAGRAGSRAGARPRHVDGRDDRDRLRGHARRPRDRGLRRRRLREAGRLPSHAVPGLAPDGRVDAVGRLLRPRHDAGRRRRVPRERAGRGHVRARALGDRRQRPLHRAAGLHRDGGDGPLATRAADRPAAPDDERHIRHPLPARARAVRPRCQADGGAERAITTHEFPDIGHADLLECPDDAVRIVSAFFRGLG